MPQEPKRKHSKARKRTRRASIKLISKGLNLCLNCQKPTLPHQVCKFCGFYRGKILKGKAQTKVIRA